MALIQHTTSAVSSQGLILAEDASVVLVHDSTSPPSYYKYLYEARYPGQDLNFNMDRGGFGQSRSGLAGLHAAQAFSQHMLRSLKDTHQKFRQGEGVNENLARILFSGCTSARGNSFATEAAEGGSATGAFVVVERAGKRLVLNGACVGDISVIVIHSTGLVRMVSPIVRSGARDPGGVLAMSIGIDGTVWSFSEPIAPEDLVVLATDGLMDNLNMLEASLIIPLIVQSSFFDEEPLHSCTCVQGSAPVHLPCLQHLRQMISQDTIQPISRISCAHAALRLKNYCKWVTRRSHDVEQEYYNTQIKLRYARSAEEKEALATKIARLESLRHGHDHVDKTDDCAVIVMCPLHKLDLQHLPT